MSKWEKKSIEEISEFVGGGSTPSTKNENYWGGKVNWLTPSDVTGLNNKIFVETTSRTITEEGLDNSSAKLYEPGTILMTSRATIGKPVINRTPMATNQGFINFKIRNDIADPIFVAYWIKLNENNISNMGTGSTFKEISRGKFKTIQIPIPPLPTQKKIAYILSTIQSKIENIDKQIESYTDLKKSVMERLFTKGLKGGKQKETEIGLIPESWEVVELGEVYAFTSKPKGKRMKNVIPFIPMNLIPDDSDLHVSEYETRDKVSSGTYFENGDLLVAKITPSFENGKQAIVNIDRDCGYATTEVIPIKSTEKANNKFLYYFLKQRKIRNKLAGKMEGTTGRQRLNKTVLQKQKMPLPDIMEQIEISNIFESYDKKISILKTKKERHTDLFNSMLHKLMNQEIEVENLQFNINS